ncbi:MAG: NUDIX domain-containing protein [Chloroflexi bacterium]|nr:NUDIX domain-containing protein [Chloroflexota bacterium]
MRPQPCQGCGRTHYHHSRPCAGAIVVRDGRVLLVRRAVEPFRGWWDIPGGFLQPGEHPEQGACRELLEETGLVIRPLRPLGVFLDRYGEAGDWTLNHYYVAEVIGGEPHAADDAVELAWFSATALPTNVAFRHSQAVLDAWRRSAPGPAIVSGERAP